MKSASGDELALLRLVLELGHPAQLAEARHAAQQPSRLGMGGDVALREDGRAFGVEPGREQHRRQVERLLAEVLRVVLDADRVQVDDAEEALAALLRCGVLAEAADQVADVLSPVGWMPEKMRMSVVSFCRSGGGRERPSGRRSKQDRDRPAGPRNSHWPDGCRRNPPLLGRLRAGAMHCSVAPAGVAGRSRALSRRGSTQGDAAARLCR